MAASQAQAPVHPFGDDRRDLVILGARQPDPETMECLRLPGGRERFRLLFALLDPDHAIQGGFHRPSTRYRAWDDRPPRLAPISAAGVNSMDVVLPIITKYTGREMIPIAILHGVLMDMSVPFFVSFFCRF